MKTKRREEPSQTIEWERTITFRGKRYHLAKVVTRLSTAKATAKALMKEGYKVRIIPKRGGIVLGWAQTLGIYTNPKYYKKLN